MWMLTAFDGNASTINNKVNLGPGVSKGWEPVDTGWKFKQEDGTYLTKQLEAGAGWKVVLPQ